MAVVFEFEVGNGFHFAEAFAAQYDLPVANHKVNLPANLGEGFIKEVYLDNGLSLCMHNYQLKDELVLKRRTSLSGDILTLKFDCRPASDKPLFQNGHGCEAELATSNFFAELHMPVTEPVNFLVVSATRGTFLAMLQPEKDNYIAATLRNSTSFVLHEGAGPDMERTMRQLMAITDETKLSALLYNAKTQELIYQLFTKLLLRKEGTPLAINQADAEKIYEVRAAVLKDLGQPPALQQLATNAGLSLTKMKELFRQVFGDSIYNYYQAARMAKAAALLGKLSVSEVGYQMGFTNLSHFTRLFEKHHQIKPKRYKDSLTG